MHTFIAGTNAMLAGDDGDLEGIVAEILVSVPAASICSAPTRFSATPAIEGCVYDGDCQLTTRAAPRTTRLGTLTRPRMKFSGQDAGQPYSCHVTPWTPQAANTYREQGAIACLSDTLARKLTREGQGVRRTRHRIGTQPKRPGAPRPETGQRQSRHLVLRRPQDRRQGSSQGNRSRVDGRDGPLAGLDPSDFR